MSRNENHFIRLILLILVLFLISFLVFMFAESSEGQTIQIDGSLAEIGTLDPGSLYFAKEGGRFLYLLIEAQEDGTAAMIFPPTDEIEGAMTWEFILYATRTPIPTSTLTPTATFSPTKTFTRTPTPTQTFTPSPTPIPTLEPEPTFPDFSQVPGDEFWSTLKAYWETAARWNRKRLLYEENGWPMGDN